MLGDDTRKMSFDGLSVEVRPTLVTTVGLSKLTAGLQQLIGEESVNSICNIVCQHVSLIYD